MQYDFNTLKGTFGTFSSSLSLQSIGESIPSSSYVILPLAVGRLKVCVFRTVLLKFNFASFQLNPAAEPTIIKTPSTFTIDSIEFGNFTFVFQIHFIVFVFDTNTGIAIWSVYLSFNNTITSYSGYAEISLRCSTSDWSCTSNRCPRSGRCSGSGRRSTAKLCSRYTRQSVSDWNSVLSLCRSNRSSTSNWCSASARLLRQYYQESYYRIEFNRIDTKRASFTTSLFRRASIFKRASIFSRASDTFFFNSGLLFFKPASCLFRNIFIRASTTFCGAFLRTGFRFLKVAVFELFCTPRSGPFFSFFGLPL